MTQKDYVKFAEMFRTYSTGEGSGGVYQCPETLELAKRTADIFAGDNPRFDRGRYLKACGVRPEDGAAK